MGLYHRSRKTLEAVEVDLQTQPNYSIKATGLRSLGNALRAIGELEKSGELLQQSLIIAQQLRLISAIAAAELSLGNTARAMAQQAIAVKDEETASAEIQAAMDAYTTAAQVSPAPRIQLRSQLNQLSLLVDTQQLREAQALIPAIQKQLDKIPLSRQSVNARINLAHSLMKLSFPGDSSSAISPEESEIS
ncbi:hypothetical protein [Phormidium sp. CCY1219]|uniref:hypothetical protein n=1 Tax=Phormidium sp. CCY1219 TaxID=2886104 RepID=UPI002D1F9010|nr:hypothetical protein [Phormidium sp. CCY1219]MEB3827922.1 hypothetical protein [Phormidium sp. CCY1219]